MNSTYNVNIDSVTELISPGELFDQIPLTPDMEASVVKGRKAVNDIIEHRDPRMLVITGPCSIHDPNAAQEFATRLKALSDDVSDSLVLVMRVYFEKPRTTVGWKGFINDPGLNGEGDINDGLRGARSIMRDIIELDLPVASEFLDPISPQFYSDMVSWVAIGARTTESQTHREMASGVSAAVGFKNATTGNLDIALNAMESSLHPHSFIGIDKSGSTRIIKTKGNKLGHLVMRGGSEGPNYEASFVKEAEDVLSKRNMPVSIVMDCSHANSNKDHRNQGLVVDSVLEQKAAGNKSIVGIMLESNLKEGNQSLPDDLSELEYGVSLTDKCIDWETNEDLIRKMAEALKGVNS